MSLNAFRDSVSYFVTQEDRVLLKRVENFFVESPDEALKVQYGTWSKVSAAIPGRTPTQCRQRFHYYLKQVRAVGGMCRIWCLVTGHITSLAKSDLL